MRGRGLDTVISAKIVRQAANDLRATGERVTPTTIGDMIGYDGRTIAAVIRHSVGLQDILDYEVPRSKVAYIPRLQPKDIEHAVYLKWLLERLHDGGAERHPELRFS